MAKGWRVHCAANTTGGTPKALIGRAVWIDIPSKSLIKESLVKHSKGEPRVMAVKIEADLSSSKKDGGIVMSL